MRIATTLALAAMLYASATALAGDVQPAAAHIVQAVEQRYHNAKTLKAVFLQRYSDGQQGIQLESGTVYFSRPGRMRWEYEQPETHSFITDGKTAWSFVPADHTVTRAPMKESEDWRTPLALLTGRANLSQLCDKVELAKDSPTTAGNVVLRCLPRGEKHAAKAAQQNDDVSSGIGDPSQQFVAVLLEVNPASGELADVHVMEPGGVEMEFRFGKWQENLPLAESLFHFEAPAGVAIVDESQALRSAP